MTVLDEASFEEASPNPVGPKPFLLRVQTEYQS
jgi:hypothetical protein